MAIHVRCYCGALLYSTPSKNTRVTKTCPNCKKRMVIEIKDGEIFLSEKKWVYPLSFHV